MTKSWLAGMNTYHSSGTWEKRAEFLSENLKGRDNVADLITDGRIILTCIIESEVCGWKRGRCQLLGMHSVCQRLMSEIHIRGIHRITQARKNWKNALPKEQPVPVSLCQPQIP